MSAVQQEVDWKDLLGLKERLTRRLKPTVVHFPGACSPGYFKLPFGRLWYGWSKLILARKWLSAMVW
jgi:hypothetical protein